MELVQWAPIMALLATALSVVGWVTYVRIFNNRCYFATLSQVALTSNDSKLFFRSIVWVCGSIFYVAMVLMSISITSQLLPFLWYATIFFEVMVGVVLPKNKIATMWHNFFAYGMAFFMLVSAFVAALSFQDVAILLWLLASCMTIFAILAVIRKRHFILYELNFLFLAHLTIVVSAFAVV